MTVLSFVGVIVVLWALENYLEHRWKADSERKLRRIVCTAPVDFCIFALVLLLALGLWDDLYPRAPAVNSNALVIILCLIIALWRSGKAFLMKAELLWRYARRSTAYLRERSMPEAE